MRYVRVARLLILAFVVLLMSGCNDGVLPEPDEQIISEVDGAPMVLVPGGEFIMGTSDELMDYYREVFIYRRDERFADERPDHEVYLDAYYIDVYEVTNERYQAFMQATGYEPIAYVNPKDPPDFPAIVGNCEDADAYASWAGKRLPTEAEWEKAARGTDERIWPWGDEWDATILNANDATGELDGYALTAPVGQYPQGTSPYGVHDMAGNVWEWTADWYSADYYEVSPRVNPRGPASGTNRVIRGGGWAENLDFTRCSGRFGATAPGSLLVGFRCVRDF